MADLTGTSVANNFEQLDNNSQGLGSRTVVASLVKDSGDATEAQLVTLIKAIEADGGWTVAGFNAASLGTDPAYVALQGTGTLGTTSGDYVTGYTVASVVDFDQ